MAQSRLRDYLQIPPNGLVIFAGKVGGDSTGISERVQLDRHQTEPREKLIYAEFEPFIPLDYLTRIVCICDTRFHVRALSELKGPAPDTYRMEVDQDE